MKPTVGGLNLLMRSLRWTSLHRSTCFNSSSSSKEAPKAQSSSTSSAGSPRWLSKLFDSSSRDYRVTHQSRTLADTRPAVYEFQFHRVKPEYMEEYLHDFEQLSHLHGERGTGAQLVGSWTVEIGAQDEAIHLWKYEGGYPGLNRARQFYIHDEQIVEYRKRRNHMLFSRYNTILLKFSYWADPEPSRIKVTPNIYELRTYQLKPGSIIEWGNSWARHIHLRTQDEVGVTGLFSNLGQLNQVYHLWCYRDLEVRRKAREAAWARPGWDENVANTVPLITNINSKILCPCPFSPLQ